MKILQESLNKLSVEPFCFLIGGYQKILSPDHGAVGRFFGFYRCRFFPSCSEYACSSLRQYGLFKGTVVSLKRIFRCNPWSEGGYDPVK